MYEYDWWASYKNVVIPGVCLFVIMPCRMKFSDEYHVRFQSEIKDWAVNQKKYYYEKGYVSIKRKS